MTSASIAKVLQFCSLLFVSFVVLRLIQIRLVHRYPTFFALLSVTLILQTVAVVFGPGSPLFYHSFFWLEPLRNILYVLVVLELFSVIFRNYAGLRSLSRWVMGVAAVVAAAGLALTMAPTGVSNFSSHPRSRMIIRWERGISLGLVIFIIIMLYFISRYPIKLPRNSVVLSMVYSIWFLGDSAILLAFSYFPYTHARQENDALALLEIASYLGWLLLLSRNGEFQETRVRQQISPDRERLLIEELNAMNDVLVRAGRSIAHRP